MTKQFKHAKDFVNYIGKITHSELIAGCKKLDTDLLCHQASKSLYFSFYTSHTIKQHVNASYSQSYFINGHFINTKKPDCSDG